MILGELGPSWAILSLPTHSGRRRVSQRQFKRSQVPRLSTRSTISKSLTIELCPTSHAIRNCCCRWSVKNYDISSDKCDTHDFLATLSEPVEQSTSPNHPHFPPDDQVQWKQMVASGVSEPVLQPSMPSVTPTVCWRIPKVVSSAEPP